jgi:hypothetical protein
MDLGKIKKSQRRILKRVRDCGESKRTREVTGILKFIRTCSKEDVVYALGDFGLNLRKFSVDIDLSHPDLHNLFGGALVSKREGTFSRELIDVIKIAKHRESDKLSDSVMNALNRWIEGMNEYLQVRSNIDHPSSNLQHIRFVADKEQREACRRLKYGQRMPMNVVYGKDRHLWDKQASNFDYLVRGEKRYRSDIELAKKKEVQFGEFGLASMSKIIRDSIAKMERKSEEESYHGFNSVSLETTVIILSKIMGYECESSFQSYSSSPRFKIKAKRSHFPGYEFGESRAQNEWGHKEMDYSPCIYGAHDLPQSDEMSKILELLDAYPSAGEKPLFDQFRVVVPSLVYPDIILSSVSSETKKKIDIDLLKQELMVAALLGEREGQFYFISYWM